MDIGILTDYPILPLLFTVLAAFFIYRMYSKNKEDRVLINENSPEKCPGCGGRMQFNGRYWLCPGCGERKRF